MADIFLSYSSNDRDRARAVAEAIEQNGWAVWWDRQVPYGKSFDEVIEANLDAAKCVIVLWTANSISSKWVRAEASEGARRGILLPILLETNLKVPLEFRLMQAADLSKWKRGIVHSDFDKLIARVEQVLGESIAHGSHDQPATVLPQIEGAKQESLNQDRGAPATPPSDSEHFDVTLPPPLATESERIFLLVWLIASAIGWVAFIFLKELAPKPIAAAIGIFLAILISWYPARRLASYVRLLTSWKIAAFLVAIVMSVGIAIALYLWESDLLFLAILGKPGRTGKDIADLVAAGVPIYKMTWIDGLAAILCGVQGALVGGVALVAVRRQAAKRFRIPG